MEENKCPCGAKVWKDGLCEDCYKGRELADYFLRDGDDDDEDDF